MENRGQTAGGGILFAVLAVLALAVFAQTVGFGFVRWDDPDYTFRCPFVAGGLTWANAGAALASFTLNGIWMPLSYLSYQLDVTLFGPGAAGHHAVNALLHALNAVLLLKLLFAVAPRLSVSAHGRLAALFAAALWAVHPQRAEAVCWIAARKELLWSACALCGLLAWRRGRFAAGWAWCALACLSKPTAMCFPLLAVCVAPPSEPGSSRLRRVLPYLPLFAFAAATGVAAVYSQTHVAGMEARDLFQAPLAWRLLNAVVALGLYLAQSVVPWGVHADYRALPGAAPAGCAVGLVVLAAAVVACAWAIRRCPELRRSLLAAGAGLLAAVAPTLGIFGSFGESARADRFWYVPSMALAFAVAALAERAAAARAERRAARVLAAAALVLAFALSGVSAAASWRNDLTLFSRVLVRDPGHGRALAHVASEKCRLADAAVRAGKAGPEAFDEGVALFRRSMAVRPRDNVAAELAYALASRGRPGDAVEARLLAEPLARDPRRDRSGIARLALRRLEEGGE